MVAAKKKSKSSRLPRYLPEFLLVTGTILVVISTLHRVLRLRSLTLDSQTVSAYQTIQANESKTKALPPHPVHIYIPWFVDVGVSDQLYQNGDWTISNDSASYLVSSAKPTEPGNIIIYGHNTREILGNIRALKGSEKITLSLSDGTKRDYRVTTITEVSPDEVSLLLPTDQETLTLYTCSGFMDSQRFVVQAKVVVDQDVVF